MTSNASIDGLPLPNPTKSYWQSEYANSSLHNHGQHDPLPSQVVDVAVIGSGVSGAVAAYMLQRGGDRVGGTLDSDVPSIVMLEARQACSGATGRNGGHCRPDVFLGYERYRSIVGAEQARKVLQNEWDTFNLMAEIIEAEQIDCDWWKGETLAVLRNQGLKQAVQGLLDEYRSMVESEKGVSRARFVEDVDEARRISRVYDALAVAIWPAASLHPLRFVHGLIKRCLEHPSFQFYTHTPVLSLTKDRSSDVWTVETNRGVLRASNVLLATNGYSTALLPALKDFLTPHRAQCSAILPPDNFVRQHALLTTASIINTNGDYEYLTQQPSSQSVNPPKGVDGRQGSGAFILGGGHPYASTDEQIGTFDDTIIIDTIRDHLSTFPERSFVDWEAGSGSLISIWTGIQGYTKDSLPVVGEHFEDGHKNLFLCLGHHGHGMARAATCARGVARQIIASRQESLQRIDDDATDSAWEKITGLPACYRWTNIRQKRDDVDCSRDL